MKKILSMLILLWSAAAFLMGLTCPCQASIPMNCHPHDGVLDAADVVIVRQQTQDRFVIDSVFLGKEQVGGTIFLPGFQLMSYGDKPILSTFASRHSVAITADTRILLFLLPAHKGSNKREAAYSGECYFWVQNPQKQGELETKARDAISLRRAWETAAATPNVRRRVEALFPFLHKGGVAFFRRTQEGLWKTKPIAGDFFAERFAALNENDRGIALNDSGSFGGEKLHRIALNSLRSHQKRYEAFLRRTGQTPHQAIDDWSHAAKEVQNDYGRLYYELWGLTQFRDRRDLPYIRSLARWAITYRFKQTCDAALTAFRLMPDKANLPVIAAIWKEYSHHPMYGNELDVSDVTRSLMTHIFPETLPLLKQCIHDKNAGSEALYFMQSIKAELKKRKG